MNPIYRQTLIAAACSAAWAGIASAQITTAAGAAPAPNNAVYLQRTQDRFGGFAGSSANADSLATGLRQSKPVTLTDGTETVTFTPPTKPMGNGNVTRALDFAQRDLAAAGITEPTPLQVRAAMMGGTVRTPDGPVTFDGVLQLRSQGMGWGQIAHTIGVHPGNGKTVPVVTPAPGPTPTPLPTASGGSASSGAKSGIVTAAGGASAASGANGRALGHTPKTTSVTTAAGTSAGASAGGVVTAKGSGQGGGNAFGRSK